MAAYNPNSIWGSKEKKYTYAPTESAPPPPSHPVEEPDQPSFFRRHGLIFFTLGIFLLIALASFVYYLLLPPATPNVVIAFSQPASVTIGQPFALTITVSNDSKSVLQNAQLTISLPSGLSFVGEGTSQRATTESIDTLSSQTINPPQIVQVIADPNVAGTSQTISATLTYETSSTAITQFENSANTAVTIGTQPALSLSYNAPSSIFSGQDFNIAVNYQNNTSGTLQGVQLAMQFPPAYHFVTSSTTAPTGAADDIWNLGTLPANASGTLVITGNIVGPSQVQYQLTGTIGASFSGQNYPASAAPVGFTVMPSPLSLTISLNNSSTYVAALNDTLNYVLTYTNDSNVTFQSVNLSATFVGGMYNFSSLKTNGSFNSQSNTITWYAANTPQLTSLAPGQTGTVTFTINTKAAFPIVLPSDKNYALNVTAQATSPTVPPNTQGTDTTSITALTTKMGGEVALTSNADSNPYPPVVNQPTQYTIHWIIQNYSTDIHNVTVSAYLQSGSIFTGMATSTGLASTSLPVYNAGTGEIVWTIPFIPATAGVIGPPIETTFQIKNTPAINQVGQAVPLLGATTLSATDAYTNANIQISADEVTTQSDVITQ